MTADRLIRGLTPIVLVGLIVWQWLYLMDHADWALSDPVKGAEWSVLSLQTTEHPSDYLPGGYSSQNRDAMLQFLLGVILLPLLLRGLGVGYRARVVLPTALCLLLFAGVSILHSEQRYYRGITERDTHTVELREVLRQTMRTVPKGYCEERIALRLTDGPRDWLMHLKCDSGLAYRVKQQPPGSGERFRMTAGRDDRGNWVLLALEPLTSG